MRLLAKVLIGLGISAAVVMAGLAVGFFTLFRNSGPKHVLLTPASAGQYLRRPQLEAQMDAKQLQRQVISRSAGQASHVVSAVYENAAGVSGKAAPQIFLFIGGNLSGTSGSDFINGFRARFQGAVTANPGALGGSAVCVNARSGVPGSVAMCAWADNDTFGVLASLTMHATQLGTQMRLIRPSVEHLAK